MSLEDKYKELLWLVKYIAYCQKSKVGVYSWRELAFKTLDKIGETDVVGEGMEGILK